MNTKNQYIAPELTVVTFKAERGYADSDISNSNVNAINTFKIMLGGAPIENISTGEAWSVDENTFGTGW